MSEIVWAEPPEPTRRGIQPNDWITELAPLVEQPKRWAKVRHYKSIGGASNPAKQINERRVPLTVGGWEAAARRDPDGGSDLYVRYLGE